MVQIQKSFASKDGASLYLCSTPIGNLEDVSFRLISVLRGADVVAAEDTRHTRKLLSHLDIHPNLLVSFHQHNHMERLVDFERWWSEGKCIALVSDAGTPLVSDPGEEAARKAVELGVPVIPVPGPSAVLAALVLSGLPAQPFTFIGFLPRDKKRKEQARQWIQSAPGTLIFYEAPHRLVRTLGVITEMLPGRKAAVAKELTKLHETVVRGSLAEVTDYFASDEATIRGEFVIVVGPAETSSSRDAVAEAKEGDSLAEAVEFVHAQMLEGISHTEAVKIAAVRFGIRRKDLYQATLDK